MESPDLSVTTGIFIVLNTRESNITPSLTSLRFIVTCVPLSVSLTNQEEYDAAVTVKGFDCRVLIELQLMMNRLIRINRIAFLHNEKVVMMFYPPSKIVNPKLK